MGLLWLLVKLLILSSVAVSLFWALQIRFGSVDDLDQESLIVRALRGTAKQEKRSSIAEEISSQKDISLSELETIVLPYDAVATYKKPQAQIDYGKQAANVLNLFGSQTDRQDVMKGAPMTNVVRIARLRKQQKAVTEFEAVVYPTQPFLLVGQANKSRYVN